MMPLEIFRDHTGAERTLGLAPSNPAYGASIPVPPDVAKSDVIEYELDPYVKPTSQTTFPACTGFATSEAGGDAYWLAGEPAPVLSPWYVYAPLCGGRLVGTSITDALTVLEQGIPPDALVPYGTINESQITAGAHLGAIYRAEVAHKPQTWANLVSAAARREPFVFSIRVGPGFDQLDSEGVVGYSPGVANHTLSFGWGIKRSKRTGEILLKFRNHWTTKWGLSGYGWFARRHIEGEWGFDAWVLRGVKTKYVPGRIV